MNNMTKLINSHSKYITSKKDQANQNLCNCRNSANCGLDNKCLTSKIDNQQPSSFYLGIGETESKTTINHKIF